MKKGKKDKKEVEYKEKAGTAWSHAYLNQKPWHPLSYPNQRRKWIAEQTHAQKEERSAEVAREFAQEQDFFRQTAQLSKKEKEKMEVMQAVSFLYMRPPGYNAEAARAAEIADEKKRLGLPTVADANVTSDPGVSGAGGSEKRNPRAKDVFGRTLPTGEEFPSLKNAPRHDTGAPTRVKPFAIEIRNVKCARCGAFGHQSGDRECPLKDVLMPSEEARLIREDPLNTILAQTAADEVFTWELKQKPGGLSPARGGFKPDDPNQQIIPDEDIYDEYGGFLPSGSDEGTLSIPNLLASLSNEQRKELTGVNAEKSLKQSRHKKVKKRYKHVDGRTFENSGDHLGRHRLRDDRKSLSSEDEQSYMRPRKGDPENSKDADKIYVYRNVGKSGNGGDDRRRNRTISNSRFDASVESRHKDRSNIDDQQWRLRYKGRRDSSDDEGQRRLGFKQKRDSSDDEQRRLRYKNRTGSSDDEQRKLRYKDRRGSSDDEQGRLRYKDRRGGSDDDEMRLRHKDGRNKSEDEPSRVGLKSRRDSGGDELRRLRHGG